MSGALIRFVHVASSFDPEMPREATFRLSSRVPPVKRRDEGLSQAGCYALLLRASSEALVNPCTIRFGIKKVYAHSLATGSCNLPDALTP